MKTRLLAHHKQCIHAEEKRLVDCDGARPAVGQLDGTIHATVYELAL